MAKSDLAFSKLNLRFNPFGELDPAERTQLAVVDVAPLVPILRNSRTAIQFLADHGRGKTTHLLALHAYFPGAPYLKLHSGSRPVLHSAQIHFIDSIEHLNARARRRLYRRSNSIAFTTHIDLSEELDRSGLKLTTVNVSCSNIETLQKIFQKRIEFARRGSGDIPMISKETIRALKSQHQDDIRAIENSLYFQFQTMDAIDRG